VDFCVVSSTLEPGLRGRVEWKRVPAPRRPVLLRFAAFYLLGALQVVRAGSGLRQSTGAIVPNCVEVAVIHFCHAAYLAKAGRGTAQFPSRAKATHEWLVRKASIWAERWSFRESRVSCFVAVSEGVRCELAQFYPGIPCRVAPNGVDHRRFRPDMSSRAQRREDLGASDDDFVAIFVGGDWTRKGLDIAISAVSKARRSHGVPVNLWIVGRGDESSYRGLARREGVEGQVRFLGPLSDTERYYTAADALVLPSLYESFSLVAVEAAACGLPLIATSSDGVLADFQAASATLICERSPSAVGQALYQLASDPRRREELGRRAQKQSERYTWERQANTLVRLYRSLSREGRPPEHP
jgi:UDP-glucose:(heptosyl)LPS alpha-1,3-glucosyltransferase